MKKLTIILFSCFLVAVPFLSHAAYDSYTDGKGIVPCGNDISVDSSGKATGTTCKICHLIIGIHRLISYGFKILVVVATVALVAAGIMYIISTGDPGMMDNAKQFMKSVLVGVIIMLLAWLIVTTIMTLLAKDGTVNFDQQKGWTDFTCE